MTGYTKRARFTRRSKRYHAPSSYKKRVKVKPSPGPTLEFSYRDIPVRKAWAMPDKNTFNIKPIRQTVEKYIEHGWIDPFANESVFNKQCKYTNDLNPKFDTTHHEDALNFVKRFKSNSINGVLYDPPYSLRQLKECYESVGKSLTQEQAQTYFADMKKEIARVVKPGGYVISCGWNSNGIGKQLGFKPVEILIVSHGGSHNDTIMTVEQKVRDVENLE